MKAVVLSEPTKAQDLIIQEVAIPELKPGWVLIKVKAFGINHSEKILREWEINNDYIAKPITPGIECVGEVIGSLDRRFKQGEKVVALMGGMGRNFNGSYAEYALLPEKQVFKVTSNLSWEELGSVPETWFTAWGSLFTGLKLTPEDVLLIRGATCALGYVAIQIAKAVGCQVIATTHKKEKLELLSFADKAILDKDDLKLSGITKVLDLIGPKKLKNSLRLVEPGGIVCSTGILGGEETFKNFDPITDIPNSVYLTSFYSNYPDQKTMDAIFEFIDQNNIKPVYAKSYPFEDIKQALTDIDEHKINGKVVIVTEENEPS